MSSNLLLFTIIFDDNIYFFSSAHPQNPDENTCLVPTRYCVPQKPSPKEFIYELGSSLRGFICGLIYRGAMEKADTIFISNPVTGETISLPDLVDTTLFNYAIVIRPYLGYDPIDKELKVLSIIKFNGRPHTGVELKVLTLQNENHLWRTIQCKSHVPESNNGICIDGILYYTAGYYTAEWIVGSMIVCLHVRSEKFSFIEVNEWMGYCTVIG